MRPYYTDEIEQLRQARARAGELRSEWLSANSHHHDANRASKRPSGVFLAARAAAGRSLIGLGHRVFPGDMEPCNEA